MRGLVYNLQIKSVINKSLIRYTEVADHVGGCRAKKEDVVRPCMDHDWGDKQVAVLKAATVQDFEAIIRTLKVDDRRGDHDAQRHEV